MSQHFTILTFYFYTSYSLNLTFTISTDVFAIMVAALSRPFLDSNSQSLKYFHLVLVYLGWMADQILNENRITFWTEPQKHILLRSKRNINKFIHRPIWDYTWSWRWRLPSPSPRLEVEARPQDPPRGWHWGRSRHWTWAWSLWSSWLASVLSLIHFCHPLWNSEHFTIFIVFKM